MLSQDGVVVPRARTVLAVLALVGSSHGVCVFFSAAISLTLFV